MEGGEGGAKDVRVDLMVRVTSKTSSKGSKSDVNKREGRGEGGGWGAKDARVDLRVRVRALATRQSTQTSACNPLAAAVTPPWPLLYTVHDRTALRCLGPVSAYCIH